jgi:hypothetical protein
MTFTDLAAAMWDGRAVMLIDHVGRSIKAVPTTLARANGSASLWIVGYYASAKKPPRGAVVIRFDSFDGHSQEPTP